MRVFCLLLLIAQGGFAQVAVKRSAHLMGGKFEITLAAADSSKANAHIDEVIAEISRIEHLISDWKPESQVSRVNQNAGIAPVKVDREVFELTQRALKLSQITGGAFDISFAAMEKVWKFDGSMTKVPSAQEIRKSVQNVGYQNIVLDSINQTIFLRKSGMKIGFGALGEGYAVDRCRVLMQGKGIRDGLINATGDMTAWGNRPKSRRGWPIGIADPFRPGRVIKKIWLKESVATSGSYEKFAEIDGVRYSHIINPKTGYPATGLISVTVTGPSAEVANGLSTSIMVLGATEAKNLLSNFPGYQALLVTDKGKTIRL